MEYLQSLHQEDNALAEFLDKEDGLKEFRGKFVFPPDSIYLCGNSLGLQPASTKSYIVEELDKWEKFGVEGHFANIDRPWVTVDETCYEIMASIVGALPKEVALMNSLSVNLHLMMVPFYRPNGNRRKILIEGKAFPSDYHAVKSQIEYHGYDPNVDLIALFPRQGEEYLRTEDIVAEIQSNGSEIALVMMSGIQYYTGEFFDLKAITKVGHEQGCRVGFDLAHAVGNVPLALHEWGPDFAVWCTYKYLNSGPGGIGGCFVHERHAKDTTLPRFAGWWGHQKSDRFDMSPNFIPSEGAFGFQISNPPVLTMAALRASLDLFQQATMPALRKKSILLTAYLELLITKHFKTIQIITPNEAHRRGCQLSLCFPDQDMTKVHATISEKGVICDLRKPNVMRIAPCPLYNSFTDIYKFVTILKQSIS